MALEGAYAFDDIGSATVVDLSGNGRDIDLTATNGQQVDGSAVLDDGALAKTGAGTISLPASLLAAMETDDRSIMCDVVGLRSVWIIRFESTVLDTGVFGMLSLDASNIIIRARDQANNGPTPASATIGALAASRHNFCMVYTRSTGVLAYYYDGSAVGTSTFAPGTALYVGADDLNIAEWSSTGPAQDNLRFFSHALTPSEVAALAGTPVSGTTEVTGTATAVLGGLTGAVSGTRTVNATAVTLLGALAATAAGTRAATGSAVASLGALSGAVLGQVTTPSSAAAALGNLNATLVGARSTVGSATAALGPLQATAVVPNPLPVDRIRVSGREPLRYVSGREPREAV